MEKLWQFAREGTGSGVRVAILDTGVDTGHPALAGCVQTANQVKQVGRQIVCRPTDEGDVVGHGTACAGIIHQLAPEAELHSVRVMGGDASGTLEQLMYGLKWAIDNDMHVINLSLGSVQKRLVLQLHELVDQAYYKGLILVAAANNYGRTSYPACFASLIAVDNQSFKDALQFHYRLGNRVELIANGIYVKAPSPGGKYRWFTGTSFACPQITGLVARLRSRLPELMPFQIKALLWCLRANRQDCS